MCNSGGAAERREAGLHGSHHVRGHDGVVHVTGSAGPPQPAEEGQGEGITHAVDVDMRDKGEECF